MNSRIGSLTAAIITVAALAAVPWMSAQEEKRQHPRYVVRDVGTFGGPNSLYFSEPVVASVNNRGVVVGGADTAAMDPFAPSCLSPDCHVLQAFVWLRGVLKDLGTLPGGTNSTAFWVNEQGLVMGVSENGVIDPVFGAPQQFAVVWKDGHITSLGSLGEASILETL